MGEARWCRHICGRPLPGNTSACTKPFLGPQTQSRSQYTKRAIYSLILERLASSVCRSEIQIENLGSCGKVICGLTWSVTIVILALFMSAMDLGMLMAEFTSSAVFRL